MGGGIVAMSIALAAFAAALSPPPREMSRCWGLPDKIDAGEISVRTGQREMRQVDTLIARAEHNRDTGNDGGAHHRVATIDRILRE